MWAFIHKSGSPRTSYRWAKRLQPWVAALCLIAFIYGLYAGLVVAPPDYQQGDVYRIIYLHVPSAIMSLTIYIVMTIAAIFYLVWKMHIADVIARVSLPIGALLTALTLISGSLWGKPTWGTYWIWDARLTSELILLFVYLAIIALRSALPDGKSSAKAGSILTIIGVVNIPIVHYSVDWWHTLHQGATLKFSGSSIAPSMLHPLLAMIAAFLLYYVWYCCLRVRLAVLRKEPNARWIKEEL